MQPYYVADMDIHNIMTVEEKDPLPLKKQYNSRGFIILFSIYRSCDFFYRVNGRIVYTGGSYINAHNWPAISYCDLERRVIETAVSGQLFFHGAVIIHCQCLPLYGWWRRTDIEITVSGK